MAVAHILSESVVFYYGGAMTIGIFLVILIILFQVIYNPLYSALYSSSWALQLMVGIGNGGWCHSCNGSIELTYCLIWNYHLDYGTFEDYKRFALEKSSISNILKLLQLQYIPLAKGFLSVNRDLYLLCFFFVLFSDDSITVVDWQCCVPLATVTKSNLSLAWCYVIQVILYQLYAAFPHES